MRLIAQGHRDCWLSRLSGVLRTLSRHLAQDIIELFAVSNVHEDTLSPDAYFDEWREHKTVVESIRTTMDEAMERSDGEVGHGDLDAIDVCDPGVYHYARCINLDGDIFLVPGVTAKPLCEVVFKIQLVDDSIALM